MKKKLKELEKRLKKSGINYEMNDDYLMLNSQVFDIQETDVDAILEIINDYLDHLWTVMSIDD